MDGNAVSSDPLWAPVRPGNPWRLHYLLSVSAQIIFLPVLPLSFSPRQHTNLNLSWLCNGITRGSHYQERKHKPLLSYLQEDHQQFLIVSRGVTTDIFLQFAAELWEKEEKRDRRLLTLPARKSLMVAIDPPVPSSVLREDLQQRRFDYWAKRQRRLLYFPDQIKRSLCLWSSKPLLVFHGGLLLFECCYVTTKLVQINARVMMDSVPQRPSYLISGYQKDHKTHELCSWERGPRN